MMLKMIKITNIRQKGWRAEPNHELYLYKLIERLMRKEGYQGKITSTVNEGSIVIKK